MDTAPFFYRKSVQKWGFRLLVALCIILFSLDAIILERYSYFSKDGGIQSIDGHALFYSGIGFIGSLLLIFIARILKFLLSVRETYYHDDF